MSTIKKIMYVTPVLTIGSTTSLFASEGSWTWSQFGGAAAGGAVAAAAGIGAAALVSGPIGWAAGSAAVVGGAVGGAASYSLSVAFG